MHASFLCKEDGVRLYLLRADSRPISKRSFTDLAIDEYPWLLTETGKGIVITREEAALYLLGKANPTPFIWRTPHEPANA